MKKIFWIVVILIVFLGVTCPSQAIPPTPPAKATADLPTATVAGLPAAPADNTMYIVTDGSTAGDCVAGGGSTRVICAYYSAAWNAVGDGTGGAGSGSVTTIEESDVQVGDSDIVSLDFGVGFTLVENPDTEVNINFDVTPSSGNATLVAEEDALQVKYDSTDLAEGTSGLTFAASPTIATSLSIGTDPADAGTLRLPNAGSIIFEDAVEGAITHVDNYGFSFNVDLEAANGNNNFIIRADNEAADTLELQAMDIDGSYTSLVTLTSHATAPTLTLASTGNSTYISSGGTVTVESVTFTGAAVSGVSTLGMSDALTLSDGATLDQSANNLVEITENSDYLRFSFDGTDVGILWSDGALNLENLEDGTNAIVNIKGKDAGERGELRLLSDGDDKYAQIYHDDTDTVITTSAGGVNITPAAGSDILLDGTISIDAGVVTGATSITSTAFVGGLTGNADTASTATLASTVTVIDSTDASSSIAMFDSATGSLAIKTDAGLTYNASTGVLTATGFAGPLTGAVTGNADTATTAATANDFALTSDADAGDYDIHSLDGLYGVDDNVYIDLGSDGYLDLEADTAIRVNGPLTFANEGEINLPSSDADPNTTGEIRHDSTVTGMTGGGLRWYDGGGGGLGVRLVVDLDTDPSDDDYVVAYDADADKFYMKVDQSAGAPSLDTIADPEAAVTLGHDDTETITITTAQNTAGSFLIIDNTVADVGNAVWLIEGQYTADDDAQANYLKFTDNNGAETVFQVASGGVLSIGEDPGDTGTAINLANASIIAWEDATETTLTHVDNTGLTLNNTFQAATLTDGTVSITGGNITSVTAITAAAAEINGTITLENDETISNAGDGTILLTGATQSTGNLTIGNNTDAQDYTITFDGNAANGVITWMEDEDYFAFSDEVLLNTDEKLHFRDTAIYIYSQADGYLDLEADTGIRFNGPVTFVNEGAITLPVGTALADVAFTDLTNGGTYTNFGEAGDDTIDELFAAIDSAWSALGGDVTGVGDCADGQCLDGSSDGGTYVRIYDGDSHYLELNPGDLTDNRAIAFRDAAGTVLISGDTLTGHATATFDTDGSTGVTVVDFALTADASAGNYDIAAVDKLEGVDNAVFLDLGGDGIAELQADTQVQLDSPIVQQWEASNDGNPQYRIGSADAEEAVIQLVYDSGAQTVDYLLIQTQTADATADEGRIVFSVDEATILTIDDGGLELGASKTISGTTAITLGGGSETVAINSSDWAIDATGAITNVSFDADGTGNSISNIENADIKAAAGIDAAKIADGTVSSTEFQYIGTLSSNVQTQIANILAGTTAFTALDVDGTITAGSGSHVLTSAAGLIDGEKIQDDTIDDDSIDFSDITLEDYLAIGAQYHVIASANGTAWSSVALDANYLPTTLTYGDIILGDSTPDSGGELGYASNVLSLHDGTAARVVMTRDVAQGGLIFGDTSPDAEGEIGYASNVITFHDGTSARTLATLETAQNISGVKEIQDDTAFNFGTDADWNTSYVSATDILKIQTTSTGTATTTTGMLQIVVNDGGGTLQDDKEVLEVLNNTTELASLDENGDLTVAGSITSTASGQDSYIQMNNNAAGLAPSGYRIYFETDSVGVLSYSVNGSEKRFANLGDTQTFTAAKTFEGGAYIGDSDTAAILRLYDGDGEYYRILPADQTADFTLTLPDGGSINKYLYDTDGSGTLGWGTPSASSATDGDTAGVVQFNTGGALDADASLKYTEASYTLLIGESNGSSLDGKLQLFNEGASDYTVTIQPGTQAANATITLPGADSTLATLGSAETFSAVKTFSAAPLLSTTTQLQFRDSAIYAASLDDGHLDLEADTSIDLNAPVVMTEDAATLTHSGATSFTITSTSGYTAVESVRFAGGAMTYVDSIAPNGAVDFDLGGGSVTDITLVTDGGTVTVDGAITPGAAAATAGQIGYAANAFSFFANSEDLTLTASSNTWTVGTGTDVSLVDFGAIQVAAGSLDASDGNITNVGDIAIDSLSADGTNISIVAASGTVTVESVVFTGGALSSVASITDGTASWTSSSLSGFADITSTDDVQVGDDLLLKSDAAILSFGADDDVTLTHVADVGLTLNLDLTVGGSDLTLNAAGVKLTGDGDGAITFLGLGDGSDEDLTINLDDTADTVTFSSSTGVTSLNFSALNLVTTGTIDGGIPVTTSTTATVTVSGMGGVYFNGDDDVIEFDLPADPVNKAFCFGNNAYANALTLDPDDSDYITRDGTTAAQGEALVSSGNKKDWICVVGVDASNWRVTGEAGTWAEATPP